MAIAFIADVITANNTTNNQTGISSTSGIGTILLRDCSAGELLVMVLAVDNNAAVDGDEGAVSGVNTVFTADGSRTTAWSKAAEYTNSNGSAQNGAVCSIWYTVLTEALDKDTEVFEASFTNSVSRDASAFVVMAFSRSGSISVAGTPATLSSAGTGAQGSMNVTTSNASHLRMRGLGTQSNGGTFTPTASWTAITQKAGNRGTASLSIIAEGEWRISTGTGDASNPSYNLNRQHANLYVAFLETAITGSGKFLTMF